MGRRIPAALFSAGAAIPLAALLGWSLDRPWLESGIPGLTRMNPVTAACLAAICGAWLAAGRPIGRLLAWAAGAAASFRLFEYAFSRPSVLDFALFHGRILDQPLPNRIAPNSALVILALALSAATRPPDRSKPFDFSSWVALAAVTFTFVGLLGYAYRAASLYSLPSHTPMALNTCVAALLTGMGMLAEANDFCVTKPLFASGAGGLAARRLLPAASLLPIGMGVFHQLGERHAWFTPDLGEALFATCNIALTCFIIQRTACRLNELDAERAMHFNLLQSANRQLSEAMGRLVTQARELRAAHEVLKLEAVRDSLTGAFNRGYLRNLLRLRFEESRPGAGFGVLMIDIDHFKALNDAHGHACGDQVLQEVARTLVAHVEEGDSICRYGGEEFVAVLAHAGGTAMADRAEALREAVAALEFSFAGRDVRTTVSIGCAAWSEAFASPDELLRAADRALYSAKSSGRNRTLVWTESG